MKKLFNFLAVFFGCIILSVIGWLILGSMLNIIKPMFSFETMLQAGFGTGLGCGLVNSIYHVLIEDFSLF